MELYKKWRPRKLEDVVGQPEAVNVLEQYIRKGRVPHAILLIGPSGCGKTTLARILKGVLKCSNLDFFEINGAESRGIDSIRDIQRGVSTSPCGGSCRVWLIDEAHRQTTDAQAALLKLLEDTPPHAYFILATTSSDVGKILPTIRTRCTEIVVRSLDGPTLHQLLVNVIAKEGREPLDVSVYERIVESADGSPRKALVLLDQVIDLKSVEDQLNAIQPEGVKKQAFDIVKALLWERPDWSKMCAILKDVDEDPEGIRRLVLANASKTLLQGGKKSTWAYFIITAFEANFFDSGKAGLFRACYEAMNNRR